MYKKIGEYKDSKFTFLFQSEVPIDCEAFLLKSENISEDKNEFFIYTRV